MNAKTFWTMLAVIVLTGTLLQQAGAQRRFYSQRAAGSQSLDRRIKALEQRVLALETQLGRRPPAEVPEGSPVSVEDANRMAEAARQRLEYSEVLHRKGYISEAELETNRFASARAEKLVQLAEAERDGQPTAELEKEISIHDAELNLAQARRQLRLAENIASQGFADRSSITTHQRAVEEAENHLRRLQEEPASEREE